MKKFIAITMTIVLILCTFAGCDEVPPTGSRQDQINTMEAGSELQHNQPTPTDIEYSLERYNLIRRTYWVNGQREKANMLPCEIEKPLGYIVLFSGNAVVGSFVVDGKVSSLNSFLTPDSEYYEIDNDSTRRDNKWLADVDGSYGENDSGIFFFTVDGKYVEWSGDYLYSDIPFIVDAPVVTIKEAE
jgi:hypothetical protein